MIYSTEKNMFLLGIVMVGGKDYYISLDQSNWFEATNRCRQKGGFLLNLESQEELELLRPFLHPAYSYWLSINDLAVRGGIRIGGYWS